MAKREVKGSIDITDLDEGESHLSQRKGVTVAGTSEDDTNSVETTVELSRIPDEFMIESRKNVITELITDDDSSSVAEKTNTSTTTVDTVRQIVSAFYKPDKVPFTIPEKPTWTSLTAVRNAINHPESRDDRTVDASDADTRSASKSNSKSRGEGANETTLEVIGRYEKLDQTYQEIIDAVDGVDSQREVAARLSPKRYVPEEKWIVPDEDSSTEIDAETEETDSTTASEKVETSHSEFSADATTTKPDITACECSIPNLCVDEASAGPSQLQSLYCIDCDYEFTAIYYKD